MDKQLYLFNEADDTMHVYNEEQTKYQIKRFDDVNFKMEFDVSPDQDAYEQALEKLGYFIVPENNLSSEEYYGVV